MNQTIIHVGLDIDDTQYHGSALDKNTGEVIHGVTNRRQLAQGYREI